MTERFTDESDVVAIYTIHVNGTIIPKDDAEQEVYAVIDANELFEAIIDMWVDYQNYARNLPQPRTSHQQKVVTEKWNRFCRYCNGNAGYKIPVASPYRFDPNVLNSVLSRHFGYMVSDQEA